MYVVEFTNRRNKKEVVTAKTERQAVAVGKAWSISETFVVYLDGRKHVEYRNGFPVSVQANCKQNASKS